MRSGRASSCSCRHGAGHNAGSMTAYVSTTVTSGTTTTTGSILEGGGTLDGDARANADAHARLLDFLDGLQRRRVAPAGAGSGSG